MTARVFVSGTAKSGWVYILAEAANTDRTLAVGVKRWPTRPEAMAAGRARAVAMSLDVE